ncbi:Fumarylacetoacetase [Helicostylum pulchrum]|nr:Fumarylacetoacetase [Helicostylum pulchrum]
MLHKSKCLPRSADLALFLYLKDLFLSFSKKMNIFYFYFSLLLLYFSNQNKMTLESFVSVSNNSDFPIQNIPFGIFSTSDKSTPRVGTAIGDKAVDLSEVAKAGLLDGVQGLDDPVKIFSEVN